MRKTHPASVKFKVALAAITGQPVTDICKQFEVAESMVHKWKKQALLLFKWVSKLGSIF